ncbi:MAG: hypothetical protein ACOC4F_00765, partial [bacterium]
MTLTRDRANWFSFVNNERNANAVWLAGLRALGGLQLNRYRYPRLYVEGLDAATQIYSVWYDSQSSQRNLRITGFQATGPRNTDTNATSPITGDTDVIQPSIIVPGTEGGASSQFFDFSVVGSATAADHRVAIVYYNESDSSLRLRYAVNPLDNNVLDDNSVWNERIIEPPGSFAGTYVSVTTDGTDLYLAYHDSANANLKFATIRGSDWNEINRYTLDAYLSTGTWTNITLIDGLPHVSYFSPSYNGTRDSIRLAYPIASGGQTAQQNVESHGVLSGGASEEFSGTWEVTAVPTITVPEGGRDQFNRTHIDRYGAPDRPVVAWLADRIEYARLLND